MEIVYLRQALKDVKKVKNEKLKSKLFKLVLELKSAKNLSDIPNIKKMSGHPEAYRIRIGDFRLGIYYSEHKIEIARFLKRSDIYKVFP